MTIRKLCKSFTDYVKVKFKIFIYNTEESQEYRAEPTYTLDLTGLNLKEINCNVPTSLQILHCNNNYLKVLPSLPPSLHILNCFNNSLTRLPVLPETLIDLCCNSNELTVIPKLPKTLLRLYCDNNLLTSLPVLPPSLRVLYCNNNLLTSLPVIPNSLQLYPYNNYFLWNIAKYSRNFWVPMEKRWSNYKILNKIGRKANKRKRRRCYLKIKDIVTNDLAGVVVKYT